MYVCMYVCMYVYMATTFTVLPVCLLGEVGGGGGDRLVQLKYCRHAAVIFF